MQLKISNQRFIAAVSQRLIRRLKFIAAAASIRFILPPGYLLSNFHRADNVI